MGQLLVIESIEIRTDTHTRTYEFTTGVNAVTGPIGSGKSSMLELLKYGLGGRARVMPAVRDNVNLVIVRLRAGEEHWEFTRQLRSHVIRVFDLTAQVSLGEWATTPRQNMPRVGVRLMEALGLPVDWRIPRSRRNPGEETVPVTFGDIYRYLYLDQNRIDTSVIGHDDVPLDNKRIAVFELVYGLSTARIAELSTTRGRFSADAKKLRLAASSVKRFLADMGEPDPGDIPAKRRVLEAGLSTATQQLERAKADASAGAVSLEVLTALTDLRGRLDELKSERFAIEASIEESESVTAQLDLDERRLRRDASLRSTLSVLDFVQCPRRLQPLPENRFSDNRCELCCQPQPPAEPESVDALLKILHEQRGEVKVLLDLDRSRLVVLAEQIGVTEANLYDRAKRIASPMDDRSSSPFAVAIEDATRRVADCMNALSRLNETEGRWATHRSRLMEADEMDVRARNLALEESQLKLAISTSSNRLADLSKLFDDILRSLRDPWFTEAHVDAKTYLPIVDNEPFDMLAVGGGRKTIVNLAYHLANLYMSISEGMEMLLPTLLMIDSPRKNVGDGALDQSVVAAIYSRLRTLHEASPGKFQIIFVDNDLPKGTRGWVSNHLQLDYDNPLVPGVIHHGESEPPVGAEGTVELD